MTRNQYYFRSSSFKMALLFTGLLSAAVLSLGYFLYDFGREGYIRDSETAINTEISSILLEHKLDQSSSLKSLIERRASEDRGIHYALLNLTGEWMAGDLPRFPEEADLISEGVILFELGDQPLAQSSGLNVAAKIHTFSNGDRLLVAKDIDDIAKRFARLRLLSLLSIGCMFLVILVSFLISVYVVSRINRMSDTALEIMETGDLSRRLVVDSKWDDLSHLSRGLNLMLDRIESLLEGVRQVSDNIAHDLRTPLTRLRNRLEALQTSPPSAGVVNELIGEADQLLSTFQSLLRISRMDAAQERHSFMEVDLYQVLQDVRDLYQPIAEEKGVTLSLEGKPAEPVQADRDLLFQALVNLLDNSLKYGLGGTAVKCYVEVHPLEGVEIHIEDDGPGVPDSEKKQVLQRFYRGDSSRSTRGSGLGLSMVAAIARLHGGRLVLEDAQPRGLHVRLFIPFDRNVTKS
jgi:signal transduction histidine kinase